MIKWLAGYATRVAVRRVVTIIVVMLLAWAGIGRAEAQTQQTKALAYSRAQQWIADYNWSGKCNEGSEIYDFPNASKPGAGYVTAAVWYTPQAYNCAGTPTKHDSGQWFYDVECPVGQNWDNSTKTCTTACGSDGWPDPTNPGQCLNQQKCLARNADLGANAGLPRPSLVQCRDVGGCEFGFGSNMPESVTGHYGPNGEMTSAYRGVMEYTGNPGSACGVPPEVDPDWNDREVSDPEGQKCLGVSGQTMCVNQHGEHCFEAAENRFICWKPRETGEKSDRDQMQKKDAGHEPVPPIMQIPNGDQLEPKGPPQPHIFRDSEGNVVNYVVTNFQTVNGTSPNGGNDQGQNKDGTGKEGDESGKGEVTGGKDCIAAPSVTGGDPLVAEQIRQQWYSRCGAPGDPSGFDAGWIGSEGEGDAEALRNSFIVEGEAIGTDGLDFAGFGWNASCPTIPAVTINGKTIQFDTSVFCNWLALGGQLVLIMAALLSLRILAGVLN